MTPSRLWSSWPNSPRAFVELAQQASYLGRLPSPLRTLTAHIEAVGGVRRITYS